jgi:hypothetical protein
MFTGKDFPTPEESYSAEVSIGEVAADDVLVINSTHLKAVWSITGIPLFTEKPLISFTHVDN